MREGAFPPSPSIHPDSLAAFRRRDRRYRQSLQSYGMLMFMDKNAKEMLEAVRFIKDKVEKLEELPTEDRVREIVREELKPTSENVAALKMKIDGIQQSLDTERQARTDLKIPRRLHNVEEKVYGVGRSKHPRHIPF